MTRDDVAQVLRIIGGHKPAPAVLARELLRHHKMHEAALVRYTKALQERNEARAEARKLKRVAPKTRKLEAERDHYRELYEVTLKRNEILSRKVKEVAA